MSELHVVLGASGALGSAIVHHLQAEGYPVRAVARNAQRAADALPDEVEVVVCDALDTAALRQACAGAAVIYDCLYVGQQLREATESVLHVARELAARLVFPSNPLVYGPLQRVPADEAHPLQPTSQRGRLRLAVERMLLQAHARGEVAVVIPRLSTFYGAHVHGTLMSAIFEAALRNQKAVWLGRLDMPHDFVYLPDAAAACVFLATDPEAYGQAWHVPGAGPLTGAQFVELVYRAFNHEPKVVTRNRLLFQLAGLISPQVREVVELLYEFDQPFVLDGGKLARAYPAFEYTPHEIGIRETAAWYAAVLSPAAGA
ncbi:MAG: NAD-dependent epimerase/dehydratase family protein [Thermoflexales bacterium]